MVQNALTELALLLGLLAVFLAGLFVVVRAAVEQGVRRALPDAALRPHVRELLRQQDDERYRSTPRPGPPPT